MPPEGAARKIRVGDVPPLARGFTTRPETVPGIGAALAPGTALALQPAAPGPGGPGTSQLAAWLARSLWESASIDLLVWISAASRAAILSGMAEAFTAATGIDPAGTAESAAAQFAGWLAETGRPWLLVLDGLPQDLAGPWPAGPAGRVLITCSQPGLPAGQHPVQAVPVGPYSPREAHAALQELTAADPDCRRGGVDLIEALGGDPLALAQACAVITGWHMTCRDYLEHYRRGRQQVAAAGQPPAAVTVTWQLSLWHAENMLPGHSVRMVLAMAALLGGRDIPATVFAMPALAERLAAVPHQRALLAGPGRPCPWHEQPSRAWEALDTLELAGLIRLQERPGRAPAISMSSAVRAGILQAVPAAIQDQVARTAAAALLEAWPDSEPWPWTASWAREAAASLYRAAPAALWAGGCHPLLHRAGQSLDAARLAGPAVDHWQDLAGHSRDRHGPRDTGTAGLTARLAAARLAAGQAADAAACYRLALARYAGLGGGRAEAVGGILAARTGLGRALITAGAAAEAVTILRQAAAAYVQHHGAAHPDTLAVRSDLAAAHLAAGQPAEAVTLLQAVLAARSRALGTRSPATLAARAQLAAAHLANGQARTAAAAARKLLTDCGIALGPDHPDTAAARSLLAAAYLGDGKIAAAVQHAEQARADSARILGGSHPDTLTRCLKLAEAYTAAGRAGDAGALLAETATRCDRVLGPGHPLTLAAGQAAAGLSRPGPSGTATGIRALTA